MDVLEKRIIIWFTSQQITTLPKLDVLPKTFLQIILAATAAFKYTVIINKGVAI